MRALVTLSLVLAASLPLRAQAETARLLARARAIHRVIPMIDTHNDLPAVLRDMAGNDLDKPVVP